MSPQPEHNAVSCHIGIAGPCTAEIEHVEPAQKNRQFRQRYKLSRDSSWPVARAWEFDSCFSGSHSGSPWAVENLLRFGARLPAAAVFDTKKNPSEVDNRVDAGWKLVHFGGQDLVQRGG